MLSEIFVIAALTQASTDVVKTVRFLPPMSSMQKFALSLTVSFLLHLLVVWGVDWMVWGLAAASAHVLHAVIRLLGATADNLRMKTVIEQRLTRRR